MHSKELLGLVRPQVKLVVSFLTGHNALMLVIRTAKGVGSTQSTFQRENSV